MSIPPIHTTSINPTELSSGLTRASEGIADSGKFQEMMLKGMNSVNGDLVNANKISKEFLVEKKHDLHEVMIALDKADLSFRFMSQVKSKVLDAYNDVMRMQV